MHPWVFGIISNAGILLIVTAIGFGWMALFNTVTIKMYRDHCSYDDECATDMNYICQSGKCDCSSDTYYLSASYGCGKLNAFENKLFFELSVESEDLNRFCPRNYI